MKKIKYILSIILVIFLLITLLLYKNIIKISYVKNYMIIDFIYDFYDDKLLIDNYENIFVVKILKNKGTGNNFPSTKYEAEVLYNIKGNSKDKIFLEQQAGYEWGILTISEWDKLMEEGEVYLIATNYNEDKDYYIVSGHENGKHFITKQNLSQKDLVDLIKDNEKVKLFKEIYDEISFKGNEFYVKENGYYYKKVIAEEKEFNFFETLEKNDFAFKNSKKIGAKYIRGERPICKGMPRKESCVKERYGYINSRYENGENIYELVMDENNRDYYYIFKNGNLIFEDTITMVGAINSMMSYILEDKLLFIYTKESKDNNVLYNIFYDEQKINDKYDFENIDDYFIYKGIEGFIVDKQKIFFNGKILPYRFDYIQNRACCTGASLFEVYENGSLIFANKRGSTYEDIEFDIIEIDLNDYIN